MVRQIERRLRGESLLPYKYRDFGSLVSLGKHSTVGNLMGFLFGRGFFIEGLFAGVMYRSLRMLAGTWSVASYRSARQATLSGARWRRRSNDMNDQTHPQLNESPIGIRATGMRRETDSMGEIEVPAHR